MLVVPLSGGVLPWSQICRTLKTSSSFTSASEVKFSPLFVCLSVFSRTTQKLLNGFPPSLDGSITGNKVCNLKGDSVAWSQQFRPLDKRKKFWKWEEVWGEGKPLYSSRSLLDPCWIRHSRGAVSLHSRLCVSLKDTWTWALSIFIRKGSTVSVNKYKKGGLLGQFSFFTAFVWNHSSAFLQTNLDRHYWNRSENPSISNSLHYFSSAVLDLPY